MFNLSKLDQFIIIITAALMFIALWYLLSQRLWKKQGSPKGYRSPQKIQSVWPDKIYQKRWLHDYLTKLRQIRETIIDFYEPLGEIPKGLEELTTQIYVIERVQLWLDMQRTIEPADDLGNKIYFELGIEASYLNPEDPYEPDFNYTQFFEDQEERELNGEPTEYWNTAKTHIRQVLDERIRKHTEN